jgi:AraC-like DNA-binding protein
MNNVELRSTVGVRRSWVAAIATETQIATGKILDVDPDDAERVLKEFVDALPVPTNQAERVMLRGVLLEMASRIGAHIHAQAHQGQGRPCPFVPGRVLERFWNVPTHSPQVAFCRWLDEFFTQFARAHPPSTAARTAHMLRRHYQHAWTLAVLARRVHATPSQLTRQFRSEFGRSIPEYQRVVRLIDALERVRHEKAESVALQVGYKSKKNFYRALQRVTGLTPTAFRKLSDARAADIVETLRNSLRGHGPTRSKLKLVNGAAR